MNWDGDKFGGEDVMSSERMVALGLILLTGAKGLAGSGERRKMQTHAVTVGDAEPRVTLDRRVTYPVASLRRNMVSWAMPGHVGVWMRVAIDGMATRVLVVPMGPVAGGWMSGG